MSKFGFVYFMVLAACQVRHTNSYQVVVFGEV